MFLYLMNCRYLFYIIMYPRHLPIKGFGEYIDTQRDVTMKKVKQLLFCLFVLVFGILTTGCSEAMISDVKVKSATKADLSVQVGFDDELLDLYSQIVETTKDELINELKEAGAQYSRQTINGVEYNMFSASEKNVKISTIEESLGSLYSNICITPNYFYAVYDPEALSESMGSSATPAGSTESTATLADICNLAASDDYSDTDFSVYLKTSVSFSSKIAATNGKLAKGSKKVTWTIKGTNYSKKKVMYASTRKAKATAKTASVKNGKTYKAGKKIVVKNASCLAKMKLDGKVIKSGKVVKSKGTHTLTVWSRNGKVQNITFKIK